MKTIELTIDELKSLLDQQRELTIEQCLSNSSYYNKESTDGQAWTLPIDKEKFILNGRHGGYPNDFVVLSKYLK